MDAYLPMLVAALIVSRRWPVRFMSMLFISAVQYAHFIAFDRIDDGLLYYASAALFDVATLTFLAALPSLHWDTWAKHLAWLNGGSVLANTLGWAIYEAYQPPLLYNAAMLTLLYCQFARCIWVSDDDRSRLDQNDHWGLALSGDHFAGTENTTGEKK